MKGLNIVLCGYRSWAMKIFNAIKNHPNVESILHIESKEDYDKNAGNFPERIDFILFIGWSWIIPKEVITKYLCLGIHPSDLPMYRGGSPIQHQIISGVENTKLTLMTLGEKIDSGQIWAKNELSLEGHNMEKIFDNIAVSSIKMLNNFLSDFPNLKPIEQVLSEGSFYKRRKEEDSLLTKEILSAKSLKEIYNFIRCLTDPYPNAYLQDEDGNRLYFKEVVFKKIGDY